LRAALERAVEIARDGCLVPPDGGSPTEEEREMCERIADRIAAHQPRSRHMSDDVDDNLEFKRGVAQRRPNATTRAAMAEARTMDEKDAEIDRLRTALKRVWVQLSAAASAYKEYAGNAERPGPRDALYSTRLADFEKAITEGREAWLQGQTDL
jgi:ribonucleotide reductase alpha subunit